MNDKSLPTQNFPRPSFGDTSLQTYPLSIQQAELLLSEIKKVQVELSKIISHLQSILRQLSRFSNENREEIKLLKEFLAYHESQFVSAQNAKTQ